MSIIFVFFFFFCIFNRKTLLTYWPHGGQRSNGARPANVDEVAVAHSQFNWIVVQWLRSWASSLQPQVPNHQTSAISHQPPAFSWLSLFHILWSHWVHLRGAPKRRSECDYANMRQGWANSGLPWAAADDTIHLGMRAIREIRFWNRTDARYLV